MKQKIMLCIEYILFAVMLTVFILSLSIIMGYIISGGLK